MRIDAYSQIQQIYKTQKSTKVSGTKSVSFMDQLQISSAGKDIQSAKAAVAQAPDVRTDVVAPIKEQVQDGTYSVSTESLAEKLFARYAEMR